MVYETRPERPMDVHRMRLLFAHPALLVGANHEGAIKAFRALVAACAGAGHDCEVVTIPESPRAHVDPREAAAEAARAWSATTSISPAVPLAVPRFSLTDRLPLAALRAGKGSVLQRALRVARIDLTFGALLRRRIRAFDPHYVVSENGAVDLRLLLALAGDRLALSVATTAGVPFGPRRAIRGWLPPPGLYGRVPKIFCASRHACDYLHEHARLDACLQPHVAYGRGPWADLGSFDGVVTMVNPAPHKGGGLFARLAQLLPRRRFRAVASYADVAPALARLRNVEIVAASDDVDAVLTGTGVLVVPSMWGEAFGMICVDAMLRGIPVVASDDGGLPEATLGVSRCIPTTPGRLRRRWNGALEFAPARNDPRPWLDALDHLGERARWTEASARSRTAARAWVEQLSIEPLTHHLAG